MKGTIARLGDRLLELALGRERAGACYDDMGQTCACVDGYEYRYDCWDRCLPTRFPC
ncbi:hypothetical protein ACFRCG_37175 [Embleya sp. NPDC056575]|uniref:hypothetical protein n=1 Tax=unclassified Embleya TaxID=2699296 RepID=UPI0036C9B2CD